MKYIVLLLFSMTLLGKELSREHYFKKNINNLSINVNKKLYSPKTLAFYKAIVLGNKTKVKRALKQKLKRYGLSHILTPSGIHLSSFLMLFTFSKLVSFIFLIITSILVFSHNSFFSLERVIIFRYIFLILTKFKKPSVELTFFLTLIVSLMIGHYQSSSLSFIYSMAFWGTIIVFRNNKVKLAFYLNFTLLAMSSVQADFINPLSLFINPFFTFIFSLSFPIILMNSIIPNFYYLDLIVSKALEYFLFLFEFIDSYNFIKDYHFSFWTIFFTLLFLHFRRPYLVIFVFAISSSSLNLESIRKGKMKRKIINLGEKSEIMTNDYRGSIQFIDQECKLEYFKIDCKEKPSRFGGPSI